MLLACPVHCLVFLTVSQPALAHKMPPTRSRRQGLSRNTAQSPTCSQRAAPSSSRQTYGGSSSQRRRSRHQQQEEEEEEEEQEQEEEEEEEGEEGDGEDEDPAESSRAARVDDDDDEGEEGRSDDELRVKKRQKLPLSDAVKTVVKGIGRVVRICLVKRALAIL